MLRARRLRRGQDSGDLCGSARHVFVLPETYDGPPERTEVGVGLAVPRDVAVQLLPPPCTARDRMGGVLWTPMPEAAVDEDGQLGPGEHDVGSSARHAWDGHVHPVAKPHGM